MDQGNEQQSQQSGDRVEQTEQHSSDDAQVAPPGSSILNSSPPTRGPSDNPVRQISRDAGDVLADEVRDGQWNTPMEDRDNARGS